MARKWIKSWLPDPSRVHGNRILRVFGALLARPYLWQLNRRSVAVGSAVGSFWALVPMPMQMIPCVLMSYWMRGNVALALAFIWLTNPITMPPIFYAQYKLGRWILGTPPVPFPRSFHDCWDWIALVWKPFYLGALITATAVAVGLYLGMSLAWRWSIYRRSRSRGEARKLALATLLRRRSKLTPT